MAELDSEYNVAVTAGSGLSYYSYGYNYNYNTVVKRGPEVDGLNALWKAIREKEVVDKVRFVRFVEPGSPPAVHPVMSPGAHAAQFLAAPTAAPTYNTVMETITPYSYMYPGVDPNTGRVAYTIEKVDVAFIPA